MLQPVKIREIVGEVAKAYLKRATISDVLTEPTIDSEGHDALRITIVIASNSVKKLKGNAVLDTLVEIQDRLRDAGEERLPIVHYATAEELESGGGP